jgi:hypothetical protein
MVSAEERARLLDLQAQERGDTAALSPQFTLSPGYIRVAAGVHPDHGEPVVFAPGVLLPDWAAELLAVQRPIPDSQDVYQLTKPKVTKPKGAKS